MTTKIKTKKEDAVVEEVVSENMEGEVIVEEDLSEDAPSKKRTSSKKEKYFEAVGRRKTSISRVRLFTKMNGITVNNKPLSEYFPTLRLQSEAMSPLEKMKLSDKLGAVVKVNGGGITGQAEATRLGIARALIVFNPIFKKRLRRLGLITRDSRIVERKKYGLKKARRAPQWSKR